MKICAGCKAVFTGATKTCDTCREKDHAKCASYRSKNKDKLAIYNAQWRKQNKERLSVYRKAWHAAHPGAQKSYLPRARAYNQSYRAANPEKIKQYKATDYAKHKEQILQRSKAWRLAHPEYEKSRPPRKKPLEQAKKAEKRYYLAHPERVQAKTARQSARRRGAIVQGEKFSLIQIATRDSWKCHICTKKVTRKNWSMDHLIPISLGGIHALSNVSLAHRVCNAKRGAGRLPAQLLLIG